MAARIYIRMIDFKTGKVTDSEAVGRADAVYTIEKLRIKRETGSPIVHGIVEYDREKLEAA